MLLIQLRLGSHVADAKLRPSPRNFLPKDGRKRHRIRGQRPKDEDAGCLRLQSAFPIHRTKWDISGWRNRLPHVTVSGIIHHAHDLKAVARDTVTGLLLERPPDRGLTSE